MEALANQVVDLLNGLLWGKILIWLLVGTGIYFTLRLGFIQLRHLGHTFTVLRGSRQSDASGISSFQALCTSLAARVGTGNIAGVAVAITLEGRQEKSGPVVSKNAGCGGTEGEETGRRQQMSCAWRKCGSGAGRPFFVAQSRVDWRARMSSERQRSTI